MPSSPFVRCENLVKIYKVAELEVVALQGLELAVGQGEFLAIVGSSGSGKTSLLNIIGGLDRPSAGRVFVGETDLLKLADPELARYRREQVGFVWQQSARNLLPYLTALENVELPMLAAGQGSGQSLAYAEELLTAVGLHQRRNHFLDQLSGGQQQRVALAVALANRPKLLLADEPTGEVDSATANIIWQALRELTERYGLTTLMVTHDPNIASVVDRVVSIRDGKTSTETVRQAQAATPGTGGPGERGGQATSADHFEERVVLDSAGRLQIPDDYLAARRIGRRAKVELVEGGILIRPAGDEPPIEPSNPVQSPAQTDQERPAEPARPAEPSGDMLKALIGADSLVGQSFKWWWERLKPLLSPLPGIAEIARPATDPAEPIDRPSGGLSLPAGPAGESLAKSAAEGPLVQTVGLSRVYQLGSEQIQALAGVDLQIERGTFALFKGRSGSGKTTLLNLIGGLDRPSAGQVFLFGQDLGRLSDWERTRLRRSRIGFIFQSFALLPAFSALENVALLLRADPMDRRQRRERALACLEAVGLGRWAQHRAFELSGGQQQRLSIARALARRPEIIIADEPTSDLDSQTGQEILALFQQLVATEGVTLLMASHDPAVDPFATRVYELNDGLIEEVVIRETAGQF